MVPCDRAMSIPIMFSGLVFPQPELPVSTYVLPGLHYSSVTCSNGGWRPIVIAGVVDLYAHENPLHALSLDRAVEYASTGHECRYPFQDDEGNADRDRYRALFR